MSNITSGHLGAFEALNRLILTTGVTGTTDDEDSTPTTEHDTEELTIEERTGHSSGRDGLTISACGWSPHHKHIRDAADQYSESHRHTVNGSRKSNFNELWLRGVQSKSRLPAIAMCPSSVYMDLARLGALESVQDVMDKNQDKLFTLAKSRYKVPLKDGETKFYGFPNDIGPVVMMYNTELFREAGLPTDPEAVEAEIQTFDQYLAAGDILQKETGAKLVNMGPGKTVGAGPNGITDAFLTAGGGRYYDIDGQFQWNSGVNAEVYAQLRELQNKYALENQMLSEQSWQSYRDGEVATIIAPGWFIASIRSNVPEMAGKWRAALIPSIAGNDARGSNFGGVPGAIPHFFSAEEKQVAKEFGRFWALSEQGVNLRLKHGIPPTVKRPDADEAAKGLPYFGGQKVWQKVIEAAEECPPQFMTPAAEINDHKRATNAAIFDGGADIEATLEENHERMISGIPDYLKRREIPT